MHEGYTDATKMAIQIYKSEGIVPLCVDCDNHDDKVVDTNIRGSTIVVVVLTVVQEDDSQIMIVQRESPNKILHDIISHNEEEKVLLEID